jgi:hypothetical protein
MAVFDAASYGRAWSRAFATVVLAAACVGGRAESEAQQAGQVALVTVLPGSATLDVGDSLQMDAVLIGPAGDTLRNLPVQWRTANGAIATVSPSGRVQAVGTGLAGITAVSGGRTGSARVIVVPPGTPSRRPVAQTPAAAPPPERVKSAAPADARAAASPPARVPTSAAAAARRAGDAAHPNEPPGLRPLADRAFLTKAKRDNDRGDKDCRGGSECWDGIEYRYNKLDVIEDPSAPFSCCTIARMLSPATHRAGTGPGVMQTLGWRPGVEEIYVSIWARLSSNWFGNQSGTNKMFFLGLGREPNNIFLSAEGAGTRPLQPQIRMQGVPDPRARIRPNRRQTILARGAWQHWEMYFKLNDPGVANGIGQLWVDGQLVTDARDLQFRGTDRPNARWWIFHWNPIFGGGGASPPAEQYLDFDHVYVSGR